MKELDLDELDQAVSQLMSGAGKAKSKKETPAKANAATPLKDESLQPKVDETPKPDPQPTTSRGTPIVVKRTSLSVPPRRGSAMDIVQSKPQPKVVPPSARAARTAPTLQPTGAVTPEEPKPMPASEKPIEPPKMSEPDKPAAIEENDIGDDMLASLHMGDDTAPAKTASTPAMAEQMHTSAFPDPLDVHGFNDEPKEDKADKTDSQTMQHTTTVMPMSDQKEESHDDDSPAPTVSETPITSPSATDAEASSPFVAAKVEKRPLGAYTATPPATPAVQSNTDTTGHKDEIVDTKPEKLEAASIQTPNTPKELDPELVAVESAEPEFTPSTTTRTTATDETDTNSLRQMSIPQQYHAETKPPDQADRPVFDTKNYHPPIDPQHVAPHKTSRVATVVTIILVLLMIAAAAVAYFMMTGSVDITKLW